MTKVVELETLTNKIERLVNESNDVYQELYELFEQPELKLSVNYWTSIKQSCQRLQGL